MSSCTCFYCRQSAPCLCDTMIEHIVDNVNQEQRDIEDDNETYSLDYCTICNVQGHDVDCPNHVEYPIYE